jgi:hypothetical protein
VRRYNILLRMFDVEKTSATHMCHTWESDPVGQLGVVQNWWLSLHHMLADACVCQIKCESYYILLVSVLLVLWLSVLLLW